MRDEWKLEWLNNAINWNEKWTIEKEWLTTDKCAMNGN